MNSDSVRMGGLGWVDVLVVVGLALVAAGCWGFWGWPAAALVVGLALVGLGVVGAVMGGAGDGPTRTDVDGGGGGG